MKQYTTEATKVVNTQALRIIKLERIIKKQHREILDLVAELMCVNDQIERLKTEIENQLMDNLEF